MSLQTEMYNPSGFPKRTLINRVIPFSRLSYQQQSNKIEVLEKFGRKTVHLFHIYELWDEEGYVLICRVIDNRVKIKSVQEYILVHLPLSFYLKPNVQTEIKRVGK